MRRVERVWMRSSDGAWIAHEDNPEPRLNLARGPGADAGSVPYHGATRRLHVREGNRWLHSVGFVYEPDGVLNVRTGLGDDVAHDATSYHPGHPDWPWAFFCLLTDDVD